ncbi:peptidoglycan DD-metalloendopeptidase family protein [Natranaerobius thermophilus]|uniref:Peptidase M23 n=1 Tax=Natranaerobius thermophilus (strain ATCC BAA-1301 / DSM 18059 / JW/NM-WN-LF) TaxID=457570 RepID=B2A7H7_NATTJ|nr:peptidoglycan DD-metalloendopeptidase family protein [Natranaerobius thermophilus]ACB85686.1 Peptidase M23 [Natranaerobius thermophilus JW/NM-WN-LF]
MIIISKPGFLVYSFFIAITLLVAFPSISFGAIVEEIEDYETVVFLNDSQVIFQDVTPYIDDNNRTMIPLRFISEELDSKVDWFPDEDKIIVEDEDMELKMFIGSNNYKLNDEMQKMETRPELVDGRTMVPIRVINRCFDLDLVYRSHQGLGLVFNFTEGQARERKEAVIQQVKKELDEIKEEKGLESLDASHREIHSHEKPEFLFPIENGMNEISSKYGWRSRGFHSGIDIAVSHGTSIKAAESGTVTFSGWRGSYGNLIIIEHPGDYETYYAHNAGHTVSVGQSVEKGEVIGHVGNSGNATGSHLHFEIRRNGEHVNPLDYY